MNINRHNCEAFFLDYHEGNLSPVEVGEVLVFLEEHPDLKETFEAYENILLFTENIQLPGKEEMKKKYSAEGIGVLLSSEVTHENCDQFFIAHFEGQLSAEEAKRMNSFLEKNPEKKKEFELFSVCKLSAEKVLYDQKDALKKQLITKDNCQEYFIRSAEGDLNGVEEGELKKFIAQYPRYKKELELFSKAVLPVERIVFADKSSLKKKESRPVIVPLFSQRTLYYAAAAAILLLAGLFFFLRNNNEPNKPLLAEKASPSLNTSAAKKSTSENKTITEEKSTNTFAANTPVENTTRKEKQTPRANNIRIKENTVQAEDKKEKPILEPLINEDKQEEKLIAQQEPPQLQMMKEETLAVKHEEQAPVPALTTASVQNNTNEYQTLASAAGKKIRSILKIKNPNPCATSDKLTWWDLAMAAKTGIQKITGTKAVDVNKACDGNGDRVEYVFAAGNFQISKTALK